MANEAESYYLSWGGFQRNMKSTFSDLAAEKHFADITLVCEGEKQISAHKVVLSASSPFFKQILIKNPHQHPLIYLKGVRLQDLSSLIEFIYFGEVKLKESDLQNFLKLSEELEVKGLSEIFIQPEVPKYATEDDILDIQSNIDALDLDYETDLDQAVFIDEKDDLSESAFKKDLEKIIKYKEENPTRTKYSVSSSVYSGLDDDDLLQESPAQKGNNDVNIETLKENPREAKYSVSSSAYSGVEDNTSTQNEDNETSDHLAAKSIKRRSISMHFFSRSRSKERRNKRDKSATRLNRKKMNSSDNLAEGKLDKHDDDNKCDSCGKTFKFQTALLEHKETEHAALSWQCLNCDTACRTKESLHRHMELKDHY